MKKQYLRILAALLVLAGAFALAGCIKDTDAPDPDGDRAMVTFAVKVPDSRTPDTRGMTDYQEAQVEEVDIILFEVASAGGGFAYHTSAGSVTLDASHTGTFTVQLPTGTYDIVVVANARDEVAAAVAGFSSASNKTSLQQALVFTESGKWGSGTGGTNYTPIPMWADVDAVPVAPHSQISNVYLTRMLARINVDVSAANFTLTHVYLYHPHTQGYVIPDPNNLTFSPGRGPSAHTETVNSLWSRSTGSLGYTAATGEMTATACTNEIYTFEAPAGDGSSGSGNTFLVVGGVYSGDANTSYYRVDLATQTSTGVKTYLPLKRNHKYDVHIKGIPDRGATTAADAISRGPSNLVADITVRDFNLLYYVYDDFYFLGCEDRTVSVDADAGTSTITVTTDHPSGWTARVSGSATNPSTALTGNWLTVSPASGSTGSSSVSLTVTANTDTAPRTGYIHLSAGSLSAVITVTQDFKYDLGTTPPTQFSGNGYVGAFWRNSQVGERVISMSGSGFASSGAWSASVVEGSDWIRLAAGGSSDPAIYTANPGDAESYPVTGGSTSISGTADANGILFRIGLTGAYTPTAAAPARYGLVLLTFNNGNNQSVIFIRQGEGADYLMRPEDNNAAGNLHSSSGGTVAQPRPAAVKWSPYNLTAEVYRTGSSTANLVTLGVNGGVFTDYPSQAGAFFKWAGAAGEERVAYNPILYTSIATTRNTAQFWDALKATHETCPLGYRRANDGSTSAANSAGAVANSEYRQSLWLNPAANNGGGNLDNSIWGFYADGFFDRRSITASPGNSAPNTQPSAVQTGDTRVAYLGRLFYNPNNYASLFIPAAGYRGGASLGDAGGYGYSWSSSSTSTAGGWYLGVGQSGAYQYGNGRNDAFSVRCVPE